MVALLNLSSWCIVMVEPLFLAVPQGCLRFVIVVFPDHTHLLFWLKSRNETLKQTFILAIAKIVLIVMVSVPYMANAMPIHMVKPALYPIIIQFDEKTIQLM